ncbi:hypothetical protein H7A76_30305 [Pseudomonas sp. MSSRFD41]|uniref:hypothetical protein n=1 Tax=Pseudomonas sp. MSSRFD41 TaxID=1310370 RepID=UPI00163B4A63|nr:hypothetical protein [Pseudomonas sp. MSSRFD41]MBC2659747.1 hypothetical protein [Pseudomonas sp. MSSRFD41]
MANGDLSLDLSASDVMSFTGWPDPMVNDYISRGADYMLTGDGDPNTLNIPANRTRQYFDRAGSKLYVNPVIGARAGWVAV